MKVIDVVAGIIFDAEQARVLLALRKPDQHQGDRWEFPGGKIEPEETHTAALKRELLEELAIDVLQCQHRRTLEHHYADRHVRLHFRDVTSFTGEPRGCEGQQLAWFTIAELAQLHFPEANQPVVDDLLKGLSKVR